MDKRRIFGNRGEDTAAQFLKDKGFTILARQFTSRVGEIDLIARDGDEIVFVEVKARRSSDFGYPEESVTRAKLQKIAAVGEQYLRGKRLGRAPFRIDVIAIEHATNPPTITHLVGVG